MEDEINLKEYIDIIVKNWKIIFSFVVICTFAAFIFSKISVPIYEAKTSILVRSSSSSSSSSLAGLASQMGINIGSLGELSELSKTKAVSINVLEDLKNMLEGKKLSNKVFSDLKIMDNFDKKKLTMDILGKLKTKSSGSFLEIYVEHNNPVLAAEIANRYVNALSEYWNKLNYTEARKKKDYITKQLPIVETNLRNIEENLKNFTYLSDERAASASSLEISRLRRELEIQNAIYIMLRREFESAKLDEMKEISPFSDIEKAETPKDPIRPKVKNNVMIGAVLGLFIGVFAAFFKEYIGKEYKSN